MLFEIQGLARGQRIKMRIQADDLEHAKHRARQDGLVVLSAQPAPAAIWTRTSFGREHFPVSLFSRELLSLLESGLSLIEALQALEEKESRPLVRQVLQRLLHRIYEGESFSAALERQPEHFPQLYAATVRASERTGDLQRALERYVGYQERIDIVRRKIISASLYPAMLIGVGGLVALFLLGYVTPRFSMLYTENPETLGWPTRLLMAFGAMLHEHALTATTAFAAIVAALWVFLKQPPVKASIANAIWNAPVLGERLKIFQLTRFYRTVGMLLDGGIPAVKALEMVQGMLPAQLATRLPQAIRDVRDGQRMSDALQSAGLTTPVALRLFRVGEKSGQLGEMLQSAANFHDDETARFVEWFARLFEPALMLIIGLIIGGIVILLYMPIFELAGSLQ